MLTKYKQVKINFKPEQFEILEQLAALNGVTKADWIRQKIGLEFEEARQPKGNQNSKTVSPDLLYQLKKIGININQLGHRANINKALDREILSTLINIENKLKELL